MADINLTQPVTDGDTVTSQTLHDMIETATISGLTAADLTRDAQVVFAGSAAPDSSQYSFWWDTNHHDPVLRVYARPFDIWLAVGPDRWEIPFQNVAGETLRRGALVVAAGASQMSIATGPTLNMLGFLQETTASGAWGPVAVHGVGFINCLAESGAASAEAVTPFGAAAGQVRSANFIGVSNASNTYIVATLLDSADPAQSWSGVSLYGYRAYIYGPKRNSGIGE